jgi:hypothetical protein
MTNVPSFYFGTREGMNNVNSVSLNRYLEVLISLQLDLDLSSCAPNYRNCVLIVGICWQTNIGLCPVFCSLMQGSHRGGSTAC